jgi:hydrogenase 3 maturation protease
MRSDDAAGMLVTHALLHREVNREKILILEAGQQPENWTRELRKFAPVLVIIIDAADLGEAPGSIQWIAEETIDGMSASTHSLPLSMLAYFLKLELDCDVIFLGIQIDSNEVGSQVSPAVLSAVNEVVEVLGTFL